MQEQLDIIWDQVLKIIKKQLNTATYKAWFENTKPVRLEDDSLIISAPNSFAKEWLESRYSSLVNDALLQVLGEELSINVVIDDVEQLSLTADTTRMRKGDQKAQSSSLNPKYTFDSFVIGSSNRFAHAAALAVAEAPSNSYNPLFIYGGVGLGKTHLLQAIAHYVIRHHPSLKVKYVSCEKFTNDFIHSIRDRDKIPGFQKRYRNNDVLLVDDIQFLEGKEGTQEEFFHTFNTLYEASKQIVISSDRPPKDIATLEDRLRSRFECGLITDIQPPDLETRIAILDKKAQAVNLSVQNDILEYIASRIQSNIRELEGALIRIIAYSSLTKEPISLAMAEEVLKDIFPNKASRPISIQTIQSEVCRYFNISKSQLIGNKRSQSVVYPRQVAMYLARELTDLSLPKIGEDFGGRDHTTVMYANAKISKMISTHREIYNQIQELTNRIKQKT
ncbi:MAG: chromosomal replication initiator protein DnaA [Actinomycetota bacterium]|nr:chromosomal replication initiator protein DnaA [Actinomycetota bacterium]